MRIGVHHPGFRVQRDTHLHVFAHQAPQHRPHLLHHAVEIQHARFEDLLAAEGQQLPGQSRGALSGLVDLHEAGPQRIARAQLAEQQLAVAVDHRQQVVEVVRHAARQPPDRFHLLRLLELGFQRLALGNVMRDDLHAANLPIGIQHPFIHR